MKAILVSFLPATNTKPARFKIAAKGVKARIISRNGDPAVAADKYAQDLGWLKPGEHLAEGQLPNGDLVYVFANEVTLHRCS